jgi:hypothetical protein
MGNNMKLYEVMEVLDDIWARASPDCICPGSAGETNPDCPLFKSDEEIKELQEEKAVALLAQTHPALIDYIRSYNA